MHYARSLLSYLKRAQLVAAAAILLGLGVWLWGLYGIGWIVLVIPAGALTALGLFDALQRKHVITRNYPLAARIRWLGLELRPYFRAYMVEGDLEGRPYSVEARRLVKSRAANGQETHPFGTELDVYEEGYSWLNHSILATAEPDTNPRVEIGGPQCAEPYSASLLNISAMSFGSLSANAVRALNLGARRGGFFHDTGEGGLSDYHLEHGGDVVWEIGSGYFGCRDDRGRFDPNVFRDKALRPSVKMTEIKLSQGAKPGHGGLLPAAKVTAEIARVRGVPPHEDCLSRRAPIPRSLPPSRCSSSPPACASCPAASRWASSSAWARPHEVFAIMKAMLETGIRLDFIVVDGAEGGTGAAPLELTDNVGMPLREGLIVMRNALVGCGLKDDVRLGASGKIYSGYGIASNLALGRRLVQRGAGLHALHRLHSGAALPHRTCPTGVTTQDPLRQTRHRPGGARSRRRPLPPPDASTRWRKSSPPPAAPTPPSCGRTICPNARRRRSRQRRRVWTRSCTRGTARRSRRHHLRRTGARAAAHTFRPQRIHRTTGGAAQREDRALTTAATDRHPREATHGPDPNQRRRGR